MAVTAWKRGMATHCDACPSVELDYAEDGTATCRSCGKRIRPHWKAGPAYAAEFAAMARTSVRPVVLRAPPFPTAVYAATGKARGVVRPPEFQPPSVARILTASLRIVRSVPVVFVALFLGFAFAYEAAILAVVGSNPSFDTSRGASATNVLAFLLVASLFFVLFYSMLEGTAIHAMIRAYRKRPAKLSESLAAGWAAFPSMVWAAILVMILFGGLAFGASFSFSLAWIGDPAIAAFGVGLLILFLAAITFLGVGLVLYPGAIVSNRESAFGSLGASWAYSKGYRTIVFLASAAVTAPILAAGFGLSVAGVLLGSPLVAFVVLSVVDALVLFWSTAVISVAWVLLGPQSPEDR